MLKLEILISSDVFEYPLLEMEFLAFLCVWKCSWLLVMPIKKLDSSCVLDANLAASVMF